MSDAALIRTCTVCAHCAINLGQVDGVVPGSARCTRGHSGFPSLDAGHVDLFRLTQVALDCPGFDLIPAIPFLRERNTRSNLKGMRFGRWTVVGLSPTRGWPTWVCVCDCGKSKELKAERIKRRESRSCGCLQRELTSKRSVRQTDPLWDRERRIHQGMRQRCSNPNNKWYHRYGGRGIKVCDRWLESAQNFFDDMGHAPEGFELDRIDNDGNYEPLNCRWASRSQQMRNTGVNRRLTHGGQTLLMSEWAEILGVSLSTLKSRVRIGWSDERVVTTPAGPQGKKPCRSGAQGASVSA